MLRKSGAKMKGKRAGRSTGTALGRVAKLSRKSSGLFHGSGCSDSTNPPGRVSQKCYGPKGPETLALYLKRSNEKSVSVDAAGAFDRGV